MPRLLAVILCLALVCPVAAEPIATILAYHEVDDAPSHATVPRQSAASVGTAEQRRYTVSVANFRAQLDFLDEQGYTVVPLADVVAALRGELMLPARAVAITLDDGWLCNYTTILPLMKERGLPFTIFVYPEFVGKGSHAVSWSQLRAMASEPGVTVASHTSTHPFLARKNHPGPQETYDAFLQRELGGSRETIGKRTSRPVDFLSYPYGDFDDEVVAAVRGSGFTGAVTTWRAPVTRSTDPFRLPRYLLHNDTTLEQFRTFLLP
jgi:peptidoglycan/xylan/chitin deacetylase (PgdA/CDA1 family)